MSACPSGRFGEQVSYELAATIEHTDGAETGHYVAHLRYNNVIIITQPGTIGNFT